MEDDVEQHTAINILDININETGVDGYGKGGQVIIQFWYLLTKPRRIVPGGKRKRTSGISQKLRIGSDGTALTKRSKNAWEPQRPEKTGTNTKPTIHKLELVAENRFMHQKLAYCKKEIADCDMKIKEKDKEIEKLMQLKEWVS